MLYIWKQICKLKKLNQEIRYTQTQTEATNKLGAKHINKLPHTHKVKRRHLKCVYTEEVGKRVSADWTMCAYRLKEN